MNVWPHLGERERRLVAAGEAKRIGRRGISMVSRACGLSRVTITKGIKELDEAPLEPGKTRRAGAGRPRVERADPGIWTSLEELLKENTRNEISPPLLWTCKSTRCLSQELTALNHRISHEKVAQILRKNGYNLMGTRKTEEGAIHPDRDAQFRHISRRASFYLAENQPVVAVETHRKDQSQDEEAPSLARGSAYPGIFPDPLNAGAHPKGLYDPRLARKSHTISSAIEAVALACSSIYGWWSIEGRQLFPEASTLLLTADNSGGLRRNALWKLALQKLANDIGLPVEFCRYPPGTSRWNNNAQKLFSFVSTAYVDEPQRDHEVSARLISRGAEVRTMALGLRLDHGAHEMAPAPSFEELKNVVCYPAEFHGDWNYIIAPNFGNLTIDPVYQSITRS
ncbi:MAG: ISAzo13 family transposase [Deltaproteobacteria bacterium]|nr:ISAzo13 family transposase [Deltaproteobacteria bacterium]